MGESLEHAREGMEQADEAERERGDGSARNIAILISVLAAALALAEMQEKGAQNNYVSQHIQVSDDYAFYQAKTVRANLYTLHADALADLPNAADPAIAKQIADARATAARLEDDPSGTGRKQLMAQAEQHQTLREEYAHRYELFELVVGALQIAIVLASVSIVTRIRPLAYGAGAIGAVAVVAGVLVHLSKL